MGWQMRMDGIRKQTRWLVRSKHSAWILDTFSHSSGLTQSAGEKHKNKCEWSVVIKYNINMDGLLNIEHWKHIWMVCMNLCKKINMKTKSWSDYQSSNIENWKIFLEWKSNEDVETIVYLIWFWLPSNIKPIVLSFYLCFTENLISTQAGGGGWAGPRCIVMTNKLVMKAKFPSCCQNFTFTRPILTSVYLLIILCNFPA